MERELAAAWEEVKACRQFTSDEYELSFCELLAVEIGLLDRLWRKGAVPPEDSREIVGMATRWLMTVAYLLPRARSDSEGLSLLGALEMCQALGTKVVEEYTALVAARRADQPPEP